MTKNLNNPFGNLGAMLPNVLPTPKEFGRAQAWRVTFKWSHDVNARTLIPDMPKNNVETYMIMNRRVGRGQIVRVERAEVTAR